MPQGSMLATQPHGSIMLLQMCLQNPCPSAVLTQRAWGNALSTVHWVGLGQQLEIYLQQFLASPLPLAVLKPWEVKVCSEYLQR